MCGGQKSPFVVTVEDNPALGLKGFDRAVHDGVVLDNCNSFGQLLKWPALLRAKASPGVKASPGAMST